MTYQERIAAAQAKMEEFKAKMAATSEKAKAARAMKKEEITAAIDSINADLDELDAAIAQDISDNAAAIDKGLDKLGQTAEADYKEFEEAVDRDLTKFEDEVESTVEGDINAAKENYRLAKERKDSKVNAYKLQAQMKADALKAKLADRRVEKDKASMENYILDLLDYAECCQQVAFAAAIEADMALLEAAEVAADYVEKYGENEIPEKTEA